jgi:hypothetical protein
MRPLLDESRANQERRSALGKRPKATLELGDVIPITVWGVLIRTTVVKSFGRDRGFDVSRGGYE